MSLKFNIMHELPEKPSLFTVTILAWLTTASTRKCAEYGIWISIGLSILRAIIISNGYNLRRMPSIFWVNTCHIHAQIFLVKRDFWQFLILLSSLIHLPQQVHLKYKYSNYDLTKDTSLLYMRLINQSSLSDPVN